MNARTTKEDVIKAVNSFPSISPTASKILPMLNDPNTNVADIENTVRYDPGLTANILKLANSAFFGLPGTISSISQAVAQLGWKRMYQLVIASTVNAVMDKHVPGYDLQRGQLWRHSVAVSVAAEILVKQRRINASDETFTAALLHDIGKVILGEFIQSDLNLIDMAAVQDTSFVEAERDVLGTDHAEVGAWILDHWALPADLVRAVRWHHEPRRAEKPNTILDLVHVADALCLMMGMGIGHEGLQYELCSECTGRLNLCATHLEAVGAETLESVDELTAALAAGQASS